MSTLSPPAATVPTTDGTRTAVVAAGLVGALGCVAYVLSVVIAPDMTVREAMSSPLVVTANIVVTLAFVALAITVPRLAPDLLPRAVRYLVATYAAFVAAAAWALATLGAHAAGLLTDEEMDRTSVYFDLLQAPKIVLGLVGLTALAVVGWRRRAFSRGAAAVLVLAGVASLIPPYPPGALLACLGVVWAARSARSTG
jgi:hypothetical protein